MSALENQKYERVRLFVSGNDAQETATKLVGYVEENSKDFGKPKIEIIKPGIEDPSDYEELWVKIPKYVKMEVAKLPTDSSISLNLSSGTPAMRTTWMMMVGTGEIDAELLVLKR